MSRLAQTILIAAVLGILAIPAHHAAAQAPPQYVAIDLGTFGGPNAFQDTPGRIMNAQGTVIGQADTSTPDPYAPNCVTPDCLDLLGFAWHNGVLTKLPSLGGFADAPFAISDNGLIAGVSSISTIDPATGFPEARAALWKNGAAVNLGTLPGGNESNAFMVNDRGMIAGPASNGVPDAYGCQIFICWPTQTRGFVWQNGVMKDLGSIGGPDALPLFINNQGQISGCAYTNNTPNPATGQPTMDLFLWQNGTMKDLGNLGGAFTCTGSLTDGLNDRGEVVGQSNLPGDQAHHPVLWDGSRLLDLGTLGGDNGSADGVNKAGQVVGTADLPGSQTHHAFVWNSGQMTGLAPVQGHPCSSGADLNNHGQVVGKSTDCNGGALAATLWEGGSAYDLNTLIGQSPLQLTESFHINDLGEIVAKGYLSNGDQRMALLVPTSLAASDGLLSGVNSRQVSAPQGAATTALSLPDSRDILGPPGDRMGPEQLFRSPKSQ